MKYLCIKYVTKTIRLTVEAENQLLTEWELRICCLHLMRTIYDFKEISLQWGREGRKTREWKTWQQCVRGKRESSWWWSFNVSFSFKSTVVNSYKRTFVLMVNILYTLSQKSETVRVAEKCDCRRKRRDNGEIRRLSHFSATVWTGFKAWCVSNYWLFSWQLDCLNDV